MFYSRMRPSIITESYERFCDTLRWKVFFSTNPPEIDASYDPDYDTGKRTKKSPPPAPEYIEDGLSAGRAFIDNYLNDAMPRIKHRYVNSGMVDVTKLERYILDNKLIVTPTDKNLGSAIITA